MEFAFAYARLRSWSMCFSAKECLSEMVFRAQEICLLAPFVLISVSPLVSVLLLAEMKKKRLRLSRRWSARYAPGEDEPLFRACGLCFVACASSPLYAAGG